jgi:hypothetical protein
VRLRLTLRTSAAKEPWRSRPTRVSAPDVDPGCVASCPSVFADPEKMKRVRQIRDCVGATLSLSGVGNEVGLSLVL